MKKNICFVFYFIVFAFTNLKITLSNDFNKNFSVVEIDRCNQLDLIYPKRLIILTATCSPEKNNFFFKLWSSKEHVFAFSRIENKNKDKEFYVSDFKIKKIFSLNQKILREKSKGEKFPRFLIYDNILFEKVLSYIKNKTPFDILLASTKQFILSTFMNIIVHKNQRIQLSC